MSGLTYEQTFTESQHDTELAIKDLLDQPAAEFLKDTTINRILRRSYNTVFYQTDINVENLIQIKDVIYAITVWHCFGSYMNSMSDNLQDTNKFEFMNKLRYYKNTAMGLGNLLGLDTTGERVKIDTTEIIAGGTGISNYKDGEHFDGAYDNVTS